MYPIVVIHTDDMTITAISSSDFSVKTLLRVYHFSLHSNGTSAQTATAHYRFRVVQVLHFGGSGRFIGYEPTRYPARNEWQHPFESSQWTPPQQWQ